MKRIFASLFSLIVINCHAQKVEVLKKADVGNLTEGKVFAFIQPSTDTSTMQFVATFAAKVRGKKAAIELLYYEIRKKATKLGANCYKINSFTRNTSKNECELILDSYAASDTLIDINTANHEKNVVFVFGRENEDDKPVTLNVNGETKEIKAGHYLRLELIEGKELKLNKGGAVGGSTAWLNWEKDKLPQFYTLTGFGLSSITQQPANGITFNTGRINRINNMSVGFLLVKLLKENN
ncbi:hypothetical protein WG954_14030 [Lacibacter sp. H375]|uniref:hypothetical protein n=1 Tax=Lacibacter sp. H375 TaxID=3133424 RepID=UPI0030BCFFA6